jgi:1,4-dihydroxy-2-naphthoate octaprenyltransferase
VKWRGDETQKEARFKRMGIASFVDRLGNRKTQPYYAVVLVVIFVFLLVGSIALTPR